MCCIVTRVDFRLAFFQELCNQVRSGTVLLRLAQSFIPLRLPYIVTFPSTTFAT